MNRKITVLVLALALLLGTVSALASGSTEPVSIMYVYTENGKGLNVRSTPYVGDNIIAVAPYGSQIQVKRFLENGWVCIAWSRPEEAYVQSRYLQWTKPASRTYAQTPVVTAAPTAVPYINNNNYGNNSYADIYTDTLAVLNAEFRTARLVTPFVVAVRPARASGWVNMRWAPSKDAEVLATYRSGARLTVLAETQSWYQVADPDTEATGFIMKAYTIRQK